MQKHTAAYIAMQPSRSKSFSGQTRIPLEFPALTNENDVLAVVF